MNGFTTRPLIQGTFGVVASTHWIASAVAMGILERGGNAFDAAVAGAFTLQVVEPHLNGPGGDVPIIFSSAAEGRVQVLCGQGPAPAAGTIESMRAEGVDLIPGTGLLPAVVPGAFDAWLTLLRDHGTMSLRDVLEPALGYAERGYPVLPRVAETIEGLRLLFLTDWTSSGPVWLEGEHAPAPRSLHRRPELAASWLRLLREGDAAGGGREHRIDAARRAWSQGFVAEAIDRFCRTERVLDASGERHRGFLTGADLSAWEATYEAPVTYRYGRYTVCKTGPWGQGPVHLQALALLDGSDLAAMHPNGPDFVHTVVEAIKLAMADREAYYGDPEFVDVPLTALLAPDYNDRRRGLIGEMASLELRPGVVPGFADQVRRALAAKAGIASGPGGGEPTMAHLAATARVSGLMSGPRDPGASGDTCHIDVIDRFGNIVAATPSGGWLQSSPVVPGLGFPLGTRGQMSRLEPGLPSSLAPGKRPRTTLTPSLVLRDGRPWLAYGTPGGDQQDQWQLVLFLRHVHHGLDLQEAIDAPLFHTEHFPSSFWPRGANLGHLQMEGRFSEATRRELERRGHLVTVQPDWSIGRLCAVAQEGPLMVAAATPRLMQAYAIGR